MTEFTGDTYSAEYAAAVTGGILVGCGSFSTLGYAHQNFRNMLTFLDSEEHSHVVAKNESVSIVITTPSLIHTLPDRVAGIAVDCPKETFYDLHTHLFLRTNFYGLTASNVIDESAVIHKSATIAERGVTIGRNVVIEANAVIGERTHIESGCIVRSGVTLGGEGFLFRRRGAAVVGIPHAGGVHLQADVEIQHGSCVDKSIFGRQTRIGAMTKLDNLVHVAHDVSIGARCLVAAGAVIAGSVEIGDDAWVGPGVTISNFVAIGRAAYVAIGSVVTRDVADGQRVIGRSRSGSPVQ